MDLLDARIGASSSQQVISRWMLVRSLPQINLHKVSMELRNGFHQGPGVVVLLLYDEEVFLLNLASTKNNKEGCFRRPQSKGPKPFRAGPAVPSPNKGMQFDYRNIIGKFDGHHKRTRN